MNNIIVALGEYSANDLIIPCRCGICCSKLSAQSCTHQSFSGLEKHFAVSVYIIIII